MRLPGIARMAVAAFKAWSKDHVPRRGAALAYYALFAIGPCWWSERDRYAPITLMITRFLR